MANASSVIVYNDHEKTRLRCNDCGEVWEVREDWDHEHVCADDPFAEAK